MTKDEATKLLETFFKARRDVLEYFGVKDIDICNYELQLMDDNWRVTSRTLHYAIPEGEEDGTYSDDFHAVFRKKHYTLILTPSGTGDAGFAQIFDNQKEIKDD